MKDLKFTRAFEKLKEMGFSNYESLVYLKLVLHSPSTAKEISESTGIPYTKVYNILENLALKGWIEIGHGRPMQFKAKPPLE
ncbi:MAG: helix-turn-helix domain-containing protein, partial [Candidatus Methanomethylicaceae archaeon]